jgi:hypothetical protein
MMTTARLLAAASSVLALPAFAQEALPDRAPSYTWAELSCGTRHSGSEDSMNGISARDTCRIASNFRVMPNIYVLAAYTSARSQYGDANQASAGLGAYAPLHRTLHGVLQITYERLEYPDSGPDYEEDGVGAEAGVRWRPNAAQVDFSLKRAVLENDRYEIDNRYTGINFAALLPISAAWGLSFRFERLDFSGDFSDGFYADTYLLGVRYGFDAS